MNQEDLNLGPCCSCGTPINVHNIILLNHPAPTPGEGWGCFQCDIPPNGATAVQCNDCLQAGEKLLYICDGWPARGRRVPYDTDVAASHFSHNLTRHPELFPINNIRAEPYRFKDSPDPGIGCLCSWCGKPIIDTAARYMPDDDTGDEWRFHIEPCERRFERWLTRSTQ